jgi:hydroxyacylglutathione hydrolase
MLGNDPNPRHPIHTPILEFVMALAIFQFPCLSDNYGVLIHDEASGRTASIDAPDAAAVTAALAQTGWNLTEILTTHHHPDHTDGNLALKEATGCTIVGPSYEAAKIPGIDRELTEGDVYDFAGHPVHVIWTPGHTLGHIAFFLPEDGVAFAGDTMFALGCGRVFEGTLLQMWESLQKLAALPDETVVYCGHEYTESNLRFALTIDPANEALIARGEEIKKLRAAGKPTVPTTIAAEKATSPYLRASDPAVKATMKMADASAADVFAAIRTAKDNFK